MAKRQQGGLFWQRVVSNFQREEWIHDPDKVSLDLVQRLDRVRNRATQLTQHEVPIIIHVACGKPGVHSENSYHYPNERGLCLAADFHFEGPITPMLEFAILLEHGFTGIGFYPNWDPVAGWHADIRPAGTPVYWWTSGESSNQEYHYSLEELMERIYDYS